ncbi:hypothetical protein BDN70DRAFT_817190, partial [Pholiota conissans]
MRPIDQFPAHSFVARTLKKLNHGKIHDSDPSSSDESSSSDSYDGPGRPRAPPIADRAPRSSHRKRHHHSHRCRHSTRTTLKPIAPIEYDGAPDSRLFSRFVTEGTAYVVDCRVPKDRQVFILSYYLSGPAYDYFTHKVALNFDQFTLSEFFDGLFNYCFPVNYRSEQRDKLERAFQDDKSVSAYVHELEELFNFIGITNERDKVIKLWHGLDGTIQQALWRDQYNPDINSWDAV